mgnify:FL=1
MQFIDLPVRYSREIADLDLESHERTLRYGELYWSLDIRYSDPGKSTGRSEVPRFIARS